MTQSPYRLEPPPERQSLLLTLSDTLRPLADPIEIQYQAVRVLGEHLGANRAGYFEDSGDGETAVVARHYTDGVPGIEGAHRFLNYGPGLVDELRTGRTVARSDIAADPDLTQAEKEAHAALQVGARLDVPLVKAGDLVAVLFVHFATPHAWLPDEVAMVEEVAERTWAAVERARAEAAQREAVERYQRQVRLFEGVASTTPDFVYLFDLEGRFQYANRRLLEVWGLTLPEVVGRTPRELGYEQSQHDRHLSEIAEIVATKRTIKGEIQFRAERTGIFGIYEYIFTPVLGPGGEVELIAATSRDVTERKRAEQALREADRRKDEFIATLSHELRNPIAPVRNAVAVLKRGGTSEADREAARDIIDRQMRHLGRLIDDLLDVSRIARGKLIVRRERVTLAAVLDHAIETVRPQLAHRLSRSLPPEPIELDADFVRLAQVFANLLDNACKYTPAGGRILIEARPTGRRVEVTVRDEGIGIAPERLPRVFDAFAQGDAGTTRAHGGLGIGLSLARNLAELHGGSIEARSPGVGGGSTFIVHLPVAEPALPQGSRDGAPGDPSKPARRVLVVDDNEDHATSLGLLLGLEGNDVATAHDGQEAVERAEEFRPDCILLDIGIPRLDGYQTCRAIRARPWARNTLIVALTGWGQDEDRRKSAEAGFDGHLVKPIDPAVLVDLLRSAARDR
jgi:PAS domain S-box-containing protein